MSQKKNKSGFTPGNNIAMKVPPHEHEATVAFYRDVLGFKELTPTGDANATPRFDYGGGKVLWIDRVPGCTQAELWLEVIHPDTEGAAESLESMNVRSPLNPTNYTA